MVMLSGLAKIDTKWNGKSIVLEEHLNSYMVRWNLPAKYLRITFICILYSCIKKNRVQEKYVWIITQKWIYVILT